MRKLVKTKVASLLAVLMIISLATPLLAAAQIGFKDIQYDAENQVVTGTVYSSVYLPSVQVGVYGLSFTDATSATYADGTLYDYHFSYNVADWNEDFINFWVYSSVYGAVYFKYEIPRDPGLDPTPGTPGSPGGPGYGGGPGSGGGSGGSGDGQDNDCAIDGDKINTGDCELTAKVLEDAFANNSHVTIIVEDGYSVVLPAAVLKEIADDIEGAAVTIVTEAGTYTLPLSVIEYDALAEQLDVDLADLDIRIEIKPVDDETAEAILNRAEESGLEVKADAVDFAIVAVTDDNDELEIKSFGNTYVERSIPLHGSVDTDKTTGVVYDPETGEFNFVPSIFTENDGEWQAIIKRNSNSIYTVVSGDKTFTDIPENHWGKEEIEVLANKLIVAGMTETTFAPNREVTRAEFTALLVRSLGLKTDGSSDTSFSDVDENAWYAEEIKAAVDAGLVFGYKEDGTFRPNAPISRQEIASLVVRAMAYTGNTVEVTAAEEAAYLGRFKDSEVLHWGQDEMAAAIKAGIVHGMGNDTLAPKDNATRAQAAGLIKRYLVHAEFINE